MNPIITQKFTYDAMSRLASIDSPSGQATYQYDANGNRTAKVNNGVVTASSMATSSNRLVSVGGQAIGYDANGNTISEGGVVKYHYDSFNRLVSAGGMTYYINPEGQRLRKSGTLGTTYFAPDRSGTLLAEHPDSGWVDYVWLGGRLVGRLAGGQVDAVHTDQVGRPEAVTNASGAIVWQSLNFPFVRAVSKEGITLNIGFPGQYYDAETGLWHNGYRDYAPTLGRYIESDPIGLAGGINTYMYASENPISNIDPTGLDDTACMMNPSLCGWDRPPPRMPPGLTPRTPDYVTFQLDFYVLNISVTYTIYGDIFLGKGTGRQYINPLSRGVSISAGWMMNECPAKTPSRSTLNNFLRGYSGGAGGYLGFGGSSSVNPNGKAFNIGVGAGMSKFGITPMSYNTYQGNIFGDPGP